MPHPQIVPQLAYQCSFPVGLNLDHDRGCLWSKRAVTYGCVAYLGQSWPDLADVVVDKNATYNNRDGSQDKGDEYRND